MQKKIIKNGDKHFEAQLFKVADIAIAGKTQVSETIESLGNALKAQHNTLMSIIQNMR